MKKQRVIRDYKALLTIYGLDDMSVNEIKAIKDWLRKTATNLDKEQYSKIARFRLMN